MNPLTVQLLAVDLRTAQWWVLGRTDAAVPDGILEH